MRLCLDLFMSMASILPVAHAARLHFQRSSRQNAPPSVCCCKRDKCSGPGENRTELTSKGATHCCKPRIGMNRCDWLGGYSTPVSDLSNDYGSSCNLICKDSAQCGTNGRPSHIRDHSGLRQSCGCKCDPGYGNGGNGCVNVTMLEAKLARLEGEKQMGCQQKCEDMSLYGRWLESNRFGHACWDKGADRLLCQCSSSPDPPVGCVDSSGTQALLEHSEQTDAARVNAAQTEVAAVDLAGSPRETVHEFCDSEGLKTMHGHGGASTADELSPARQLESAILADIAHELESNNVDKMAKEIFTFYVCVRWIPDETFWQLVRQELAAELIKPIVDHKENLDQAIAELYQTYKYVPLLCSKNLNVFEETDDEDNTYFRHFKKQVNKLSTWLEQSASSLVGKRLQQTDQVFCGDKQMNNPGCHAELSLKEWTNQASRIVTAGLWSTDFETKRDKWSVLQALFQSFKATGNSTWDADLSSWKERFPFHSFIDKPGGMPMRYSPKSDERFVVCFGKRVASELHRRPNGQHILADQNNIGCHGWWSAGESSQMLRRIVQLWRPPTCQLASMTYHMKKEILAMFQKMNERLFDALPTMLNDEALEDQGILDDHLTGPGPYVRKSLVLSGKEYVDGMRVTALEKIMYPPDCCLVGCHSPCEHMVRKGEFGVVKIDNGKLTVAWDNDPVPFAISANTLKVLPHGWRSPKGFVGHMSDIVAGVSRITDEAKEIFGSIFQHKYTGLAEMMSESVSKWAVCPVRTDADVDKLDAKLGVEDAAFHDFRKEAYGKWTGYKKQIPGETCVDWKNSGLGNEGDFPGCKVCEISELHADHIEKYTDDNGVKEDFICPIRPPLPSDEQLTVLSEKKAKCFLRMTDEQRRQFEWPYQGKFPARKQHERKPNAPNTKFELLKLLKVPGGGETSQTSFGRSCSVEEKNAMPRFCMSPKIHNNWPTVGEMAEALSEAVNGALGVSASAIASTIGTFQAALQNTTSRNTSLKENAAAVSEKVWDGLTGAGRLLQSTAQVASSKAIDRLPGGNRRKKALESSIFGKKESGELLHELSFQRSIGESGRTSNSKERFQRYVVSCPCADFDPAFEFAMKRKWGDVALRMMRETYKFRGEEVFDELPDLSMLVRGEARLYERDNNQTANATWFGYGAAMQLLNSQTGQPKENKEPECSLTVGGCRPAHLCAYRFPTCKPKMQWSSSGWWVVSDGELSREVGGSPISAGQTDLASLCGLHVQIFCGAKSSFGTTGGVNATIPLLECLKQGMETNARLKSKEPWKLFFPDEVVVVATFSDIKDRRCKPAADAAGRKEMLCHGAEHDDNLDFHISRKAKTTTSASGKYMGIHSGAGFPRGTVEEVVLRPEDALEALGLLRFSDRKEYITADSKEDAEDAEILNEDEDDELELISDVEED